MNLYGNLTRHSGNRDLFRSIEMSVMALNNGHPFHLHAEGLRGTGKTTIMRAARDLLPPITRIANCLYNCRPDKPHCPAHRHLSSREISAIGTEIVPCPFLEISHASKIGTVVGSVDLQRLTDPARPAAALLPGIIPQAHRGIIFIDEINRLADTSPELADILLDVMGTKPGRIQVEESGLPVIDLAVEVTVWSASNPDEDPGPLSQIRKQLADRFDMVITMGRPEVPQDILNILDKQTPGKTRMEETGAYTNLQKNVASVQISEDIYNILASIYIDFSLESIRAVEAMEMGTKLAALAAGRELAMIDDVAAVVPLVLGHRTDNNTIMSILKYLERLNGIHSAEKAAPVTPVPNSSESRPESSPFQAEKKFWWRDIWQKMIAKLNLNLTGAGSNQSNRTAAPTGGSTARYNSSGGMTVADPLKSAVVAPPQPAIPLSGLPAEEFVSSEEHKTHG
ncbi:Hypothetical protein LUCI_1257 [Lucifera butyrica]|uniref:ChlI/MoxR AAA lid domain-containing protein n=1 Tax=Lucifera butyrica TaxID=1351585 RepID=A0A498R0K7_9FIRM|nr:magnesium chelatase [Lucifera butyrica]VBB06046.1 Hypothetical protein LUCI_1257 [Lucifera butyrica]